MPTPLGERQTSADSYGRAADSSVLSLGERQLAEALPQMMFFLLENTFFSSQWWESVPLRAKRHLRALAEEVVPIFSETTFLQTELTPWTSLQVQRPRDP